MKYSLKCVLTFMAEASEVELFSIRNYLMFSKCCQCDFGLGRLDIHVSHKIHHFSKFVLRRSVNYVVLHMN